jgi:hypothetical protein
MRTKQSLKTVLAAALLGVGAHMVQAASPPTTDLSLWLKADTGITLNGSGVAQWADQSGLGHDAYQPTAANQPQLVTAAIGAPAVRFDGANDFLNFTNNINELTGLSIFIVANNTSPTQTGGTGYSDSPAIFWNETAGWGWVFLSPFQTNVNWRIGTTVQNNNERYSRPASIGSGYSLTTLVKNLDAESLYVNKSLARGVSGKGLLVYGSREDGYLGRGQSAYYAGEILEVLVYNAALSDTDRQAVEDYLYTKYLSNQQPVVAITGPSGYASFTAPATITVTADAVDDGVVTNVEFFANGVSIGYSTTAPFSVAWNNVAAGAYVLTAKATDNQGASGTSAKAVVRVNYATPSEGPLMSGLGLWYKADAGLTQSGGKVSVWADQSGFERNATQTGADAQPTLITGGNGKPSVSFDGIANFMNFAMPVSGLNGLTVVIVANNTAPQNTGDGGEGSAILYWNETGSWGGMNVGVFQDSATWRIGTGQAQSSTPNYPGPALTRPVSLQRNYSRTVVVKDGTTETMYTNGVAAVTVTGKLATTALINGDSGRMGFGLGGADWMHFRGEIQEILLYTNALSAGDLANLETYLTGKYWSQPQPTVAITSPAANTLYTAPASVTVSVNPVAAGSITNLSLYDGGVLVGSLTSAPWQFVLPNAAPGEHTFVAMATDSAGLFNYSAPVMVFVRAVSGFTLIENFENRALTSLAFQGDWTGVFPQDKVVMDTTSFAGGNTNNKTLLQIKNNQTLAFPLLLPQGETGTLFFRAASTTWSREQLYLGLSDGRSYGRAPISDFTAQMTRDTGSSLANKMIGVRDGGAYYNSLTNFASDTWYKIWIVANNASDTFKVYIQGGEYPVPTAVQRNGSSTFAFRNAAANKDIIRFLIWSAATTRSVGGFWIDDVYLAPGENLTDPTLPAPPSLSVAKSGSNIVVSWPASAAGYGLQASDALVPSAWTAVTNTPVPSGSDLTVTLPAGSASQYFRLKK